MTVNNADSVVTYHANGATTQWVFGFPAVEAQFIEVFVTDPLGVQTTINPTFFQVILDPLIGANPTSQGGKVVYPLAGAPLANGNLITIVRNLPVEQTVSLANQSIIYPPVIEQEFDYLTLLTRTGTESLSRAFKVGFGDPIPALVPPVAERANHTAFFDSEGNLTPGEIPGQGVFISAAMIPVVQAATIPVARGLLGVYSKAEVDSLISAIYSTGDLKPTHRTVADPGWILWIDGSIGNTGSGAGILADASTLALFTLYYNNYSDVNCPLRDKDGLAKVRSDFANAAAAFTALCRMNLPRGGGRSFGIAGQGAGLTNRILGSAIGAETETPTIDKTASHQHASTGQFTNYSFPAELSVPYQVGPGGGADVNRTIGVAFEGGGLPLNIMGPTTYVNIMVRL